MSLVLQYIVLMITAKREAFRVQIRRKQIQDKFRVRRRQYNQFQKTGSKFVCSAAQQEQFIGQTHNILYNLQQMAGGNDYYICQHLMDLKNLIKSKKKMMKVIAKQEHQVIESLSKILQRLNQSNVNSNSKIIVFELIIIIMADLVEFEDVTDLRIDNSRFLEAILPYLTEDIKKKQMLIALYAFLGNATRQSHRIAHIYTQLKIPNMAIKLIKNINPEAHEKVIKQFLFFLRSYFVEAHGKIKLQQQQVLVCVSASTAVIDLLITQDMRQEENAVELEDALKVFKHLLDLEIYECGVVEIEKFLDIIKGNIYRIEIKRQALYIIDSIIYQCDSEDLDDYVLHRNILDKIWSVDQQVKYISLNIFSNIALNSNFRAAILPFLTQMRLQLHFNPQNKFLYRLILNYLTANKFEISSTSQQCLINELLSTQSRNVQIMQIQVSIWVGLCYKKYDQKPPLRLLQASHVKDVHLLNYLVDRGELIFGSVNNEMRNQSEEETIGQ